MIWRPYSRLIVQGHFGEPTLAHHFSVRQACPFRSGAARHGHYLGMGPLAEGYGRLHDLRHTFRHSSRRRRRLRVTMLALIGYMSQSMLERYLAHSNDSKTGCGSGITLRQKGENSEVVPVKVPVASNRREFTNSPASTTTSRAWEATNSGTWIPKSCESTGHLRCIIPVHQLR
jgi:hypothetical protein